MRPGSFLCPLQAEGEAIRDHALRALRSFVHGFATLQSGGGFEWSADVDESVEWLIDLVDRSLRDRPEGAARHQ